MSVENPSGATQRACRTAVPFSDVSIAIVPYPALGDITLYLRLGWLFHCSGAQVTFFSSVLCSARQYFPWLMIAADENLQLGELSKRFGLVVACFEKVYCGGNWLPAFSELPNVAFVTAKKIPRASGLDGRGVIVGSAQFPRASRAFCLDSASGKSMVDWVDSYAKEVFNLQQVPMPDYLNESSDRDPRRVLIFPTTPHPKKNYWLGGFHWLARALQNRGWRVEFVCMPAERDHLVRRLSGFDVISFPDIKSLMDHVAKAAVVISNDSGGGHLASLFGLSTFTITRRDVLFAWRPGFNERNAVISPWFRFRWLRKGYIWRPFVPVWRIIGLMGSRN